MIQGSAEGDRDLLLFPVFGDTEDRKETLVITVPKIKVREHLVEAKKVAVKQYDSAFAASKGVVGRAARWLRRHNWVMTILVCICLYWASYFFAVLVVSPILVWVSGYSVALASFLAWTYIISLFFIVFIWSGKFFAWFFREER